MLFLSHLKSKNSLRAVAACATILLAACGGGGGEDSTNAAQADSTDSSTLAPSWKKAQRLAAATTTTTTSSTTTTTPTTTTTSPTTTTTSPTTTTTSPTTTTTSPTTTTTSPTTTTTSPTTTTTSPTTTTATGKVYYVDAVNGNDSNDGRSTTTAWRTIDKVANESANTSLHPNGFAAGDQILFRRGQTFQTSGYPIIKTAGTASAPVVIDAWGDGAAPRLDNVGPNSYDIVMKLQGSYGLVRNLAIIKSNSSNVTEVGISLLGDGHRITATDFSGVGVGVRMEGTNQRLDHSTLHDLTMVVADSASNNDYGAMGVLVTKASNISIDHNRFDRLTAPSPDYGVDGSAMEIFNGASNVQFFNNVVNATNAFTEIGGSVSTDTVKGIYYHHNLVINAASIGAFHNNTNVTFGINTSDVRFEHNTFVKTTTNTNTGALLSFDTPPAANLFYWRNNLISYTNSSRMFYNSGQLVHQNNLYSLASATIGDNYVMTSTEFTGAPAFRDAANWDFHINSNSPAIDRGAALGYKLDFDDAATPNGTAPDVGAFEFR